MSNEAKIDKLERQFDFHDRAGFLMSKVLSRSWIPIATAVGITGFLNFEDTQNAAIGDAFQWSLIAAGAWFTVYVLNKLNTERQLYLDGKISRLR